MLLFFLNRALFSCSNLTRAVIRHTCVTQKFTKFVKYYIKVCRSLGQWSWIWEYKIDDSLSKTKVIFSRDLMLGPGQCHYQYWNNWGRKERVSSFSQESLMWLLEPSFISFFIGDDVYVLLCKFHFFISMMIVASSSQDKLLKYNHKTIIFQTSKE